MEQTRRSRKKDATHRAIMHSAKMLFEENGIGNVTIDRIAEGADVSRSTFFSHFDSLDDLLTQIADEEIDDILDAAEKDGNKDINAVFEQLTKDTYPYPYLMCELVVKSILNNRNTSVSKVIDLFREEIESGGYDKMLKFFSSDDVSSVLFGAYFGLVFNKIISGESFDDPDEINDKIQQLIKYLKNREEN